MTTVQDYLEEAELARLCDDATEEAACRCGHVREDHIPMDFDSARACGVAGCPCDGWEEA